MAPPRPEAHVLALLLAACVNDPLTGCADYPADATAPDGVLTDADTCGYWAINVGEHLYATVGVTDENTDCSWTLGDGIDLNAEPIYTHMSGDIAKNTFDVVGIASTGSTWAGFDVSCDDGAAWSARIQVTGS